MKSRDFIGHYFSCFQAATGEGIDVRIVSAAQDGTVELDRFSHADCDAQGALLKIQLKRGETDLELPKQRNEKQPSLLRQILFMKRYLATLNITPHPTLAREPSTRKLPDTRAFHHLSLEETENLQLWVKELGVSTTAFLTWTLHKAIGFRGQVGEHTCLWSVPVNLRGPLQLADSMANHAVPLFFPLHDTSSLPEAHAMLQEQIGRGIHWGAYRLLAILGRFHPRIYSFMIRYDEAKRAKKGQWFAIFSNVGAINGDPRISARALLAPADPTAPLTGTALTWNGRMSLGLSVHHSFHIHSLMAAGLMETWLSILRSFLRSPSAEALANGLPGSSV